MYTVQDYSILYNYTVRLVICEDLHFSHTWKSLVWLPEQYKNRKNEAKSIYQSHKYMIPSFSWLDTGTSIKRGGDKLALWAQISPINKMMQSYKWFPRVRKMQILAYNHHGNYWYWPDFWILTKVFTMIRYIW
jgi:hypothetical protein